jgi:adenosine/AMP kinase
MDIKVVQLEFPENCNVIVGQTHFIKTVEDLHEIMVGTVPSVKFGLAFCEASGDCLLRIEGNDDELKGVAETNGLKISAGHTFFVVMRDAFPINVLNGIKMCQEVCHIFCATANPVQVIIAETEQGRGVLGVIDGASPRGVEQDADVAWRKDLLRKFNYKL